MKDSSTELVELSIYTDDKYDLSFLFFQESHSVQLKHTQALTVPEGRLILPVNLLVFSLDMFVDESGFHDMFHQTAVLF